MIESWAREHTLFFGNCIADLVPLRCARVARDKLRTESVLSSSSVLASLLRKQKGLDMSEEKKAKAGCTIAKLEYDSNTKTVTWEAILKSSLKCEDWEVGEYETRVDGTRIPLETLMRALIIQYIGVRKINAPLKRGTLAEARAALKVGFDWNTMFTRAAVKLTPGEQALRAVPGMTDLDELNKLLAEVQAKVAELTKSETPT